jgi:hypothetical protein
LIAIISTLIFSLTHAISRHAIDADADADYYAAFASRLTLFDAAVTPRPLPPLFCHFRCHAMLLMPLLRHSADS